jgi:hypothetical protein
MTIEFVRKRLQDQQNYVDVLGKNCRNEVFVSAYETLMYWRNKLNEMENKLEESISDINS